MQNLVKCEVNEIYRLKWFVDTKGMIDLDEMMCEIMLINQLEIKSLKQMQF